MQQCLHFQDAEVQAYAFVRAATEGHPGVAVGFVLAALLGEAFRVECVGVGPALGGEWLAAMEIDTRVPAGM